MPVRVPDRADLVVDPRAGRHGLEMRAVDADGKGADLDPPPFVSHPAAADGVRQVRGFGHRTEEVARVRRRVETDEVRPEQTVEDLPGVLVDAEQLRRRKRNVQEEADLRLRALPPDHPRHEHEVVVVDPDVVALVVLVEHPRGELAVDVAVGLPVRLIELAVLLEVVEQRPDRSIGVAEVVPRDLLLGEIDGTQLVGHLAPHRLRDRDVVRHRGVASGPSEPQSPGRLHHRIHRGHEPPQAALEPDAAVDDLDAVRQPVADQQETARKQLPVDDARTSRSFRIVRHDAPPRDTPDASGPGPAPP